MSPFRYVGSELDVFASAVNWKQYVAREVRPFLGASVVEVGPGLGATTAALCTPQHERWVCLEPDETLAAHITDAQMKGQLPAQCEVVVGTMADAVLPGFDSVVYIDVLEHIADDRAELAAAARHLRPGGHLVVLSPAYTWLYSAFDRSVGHHRRYSRRSLTAIAPPRLRLVRARYLDVLGIVASLANRLVLNQNTPTSAQIKLWDSWMIPASERLDPLLRYALGRSILMVWRAKVLELPTAHKSSPGPGAQ